MNLIVSPHTDDAIFSIGQFLTTLEDILIISVFAGIPQDKKGKAKHTKLRYEHTRVCEKLGAKKINGDFLDDVYERTDSVVILNWLKKHINKEDILYFPMGIYHPDHVQISLLAKEFTNSMFIYEELPYRVLYPDLIKIEKNYISTTFMQSSENKLELVKIYMSQIDGDLIEKLMVEERIWRVV